MKHHQLIAQLAVLNCAFLSSPVTGAVYRAWIRPFGEDSSVYGTVSVFANNHAGGGVAYYGNAYGVPPRLGIADCTATNACGAHIHSGTSCDSVEGQGGHLFDSTVVADDPWLEERYTSTGRGYGEYSGVVTMGSDDIEGRAFLIHDDTGARIGCGLLKKISDCGTRSEYMCPPFSNVRWGNQCLYSSQGCVCDWGFEMRGTTCAALHCGDYQCPANSEVKEDASCPMTIRDCVCNYGYRRQGGYCIPSGLS